MTATFLLPLATGACFAIYQDDTTKILQNGFGVVALVAMTPLIVIQILGLVYQIKIYVSKLHREYEYEEVIDFDLDIKPEIMYE